jgi:hypothetical protein
MIAWLMGIITLILLLFIFWRGRSKTLKDRFERPKFQFLRNLGIASPMHKEESQPKESQENNHAKRNS